MQTYKIEIDERVWNYLKSKAEPFEDTPNSVLNRILLGGQLSGLQEVNRKSTISTPPIFPDGAPKALAQILEVIYEVKKSGRNRREATNLVAQRRNTAPQTVIDKYCRQLGKRAYEIDRLLEDQKLGELRALLEKKFVNHREVINSFFASLNGRKNMEEHHA
ncbi:MAG: hypothetical protein PHT49_04595 [Desulfovibrionales bacterium]|nr:hypothetical protein [Desulfovibrionales bacterium]